VGGCYGGMKSHWVEGVPGEGSRGLDLGILEIIA
jgi:hypothetical protein